VEEIIARLGPSSRANWEQRGERAARSQTKISLPRKCYNPAAAYDGSAKKAAR